MALDGRLKKRVIKDRDERVDKAFRLLRNDIELSMARTGTGLYLYKYKNRAKPAISHLRELRYDLIRSQVIDKLVGHGFDVNDTDDSLHIRWEKF